LGTSTAKKSSKPRSIDGWSLETAVHLDTAVPGFLTFLVCASTLRRQTILTALAELVLDGPESLAARLRPRPSADCLSHLDPREQIARALMASMRAREIIRAEYGHVPDGLVGVCTGSVMHFSQNRNRTGHSMRLSLGSSIAFVPGL